MALIAESKNFSSPTADGTQNESLTGAVWGSEAPKIHMAVGYNSSTSTTGTTTVKPNADGTGAVTNWDLYLDGSLSAAAGAAGDRSSAINSGTASPVDDDFINSSMSEGGGSETTYFGFEDMPDDFDAITAVTATVRQKIHVQSNDGVKYQLFQSDGTTALSDEIVLDADGTDISATFRTDTLSFTRTGSTTDSIWNGVQIKVTHIGNEDYGDNPDFWISEMQLEIDYDKPAAAAADVNTDISNSIGWATNDADCAIGFSSQNGVGTTVADRTHQNAYCIHPLQVGGGTYERAVQSSYSNAPVVGHTWSSSATDGYNYFLMALGGSDITNVSIDTIASPTSTGDVSYTGVGFQPDFLFVIWQLATSLPQSSIHIANGFGMSDGTTEASVCTGSQDALSASSNTNSVLSNKFIYHHSVSSLAELEGATVKTLDADGYTLTWEPCNPWSEARDYSVIAVKGPFAKVVHALQAASNTTSDVSTATYTTGTTTVKPNADGTGATQWSITGGPSTRYGAINNGTDPLELDDEDFINSSMVRDAGSETTYFGFEDMPADFVTATSVTVKVRQKIHVQSGKDGVKYQLFDSFGTTALSDEIVLDADGTDISSSFRTDTLSFTRTGSTTQSTASKSRSTWNGVQIKVTHIGNEDNGDDPELWISEMQLEIAYVTSTVDTESGTGAGFVPKAGICIGAMKTESQVATAHNRVTIGTWDAQDNMDSMGWMDEDNQSTTDADSYISSTHSINNYNHAQAIVGQAAVAANGNGIQETWTNTDGTQYAHAWLLLGDAPASEIVVTGLDDEDIADGDSSPRTADGTDFGTITVGDSAVTRTFTVTNNGDALTTSTPTIPTGFTLTEGLDATIAAGANDTFSVRLDNSVVGTKSGDISITNNDADENPFNFAITGEVSSATPPVSPAVTSIIVSDVSQLNTGNALVSIGGARGLGASGTLITELSSKNALDRTDYEPGDPVSVLDDRYADRFDDIEYYHGSGSFGGV